MIDWITPGDWAAIRTACEAEERPLSEVAFPGVAVPVYTTPFGRVVKAPWGEWVRVAVPDSAEAVGPMHVQTVRTADRGSVAEAMDVPDGPSSDFGGCTA